MEENQKMLNPIEREEISQGVGTNKNRHLILYNDDINTFDYVISCLIEICEHDFVQAERGAGRLDIVRNIRGFS